MACVAGRGAHPPAETGNRSPQPPPHHQCGPRPPVPRPPQGGDFEEAGINTEALAALKEEGNKHFAQKAYEQALDCYDRALRLVPGTNPDAALLHSNKAACHMMHKK